MVSDPTVNDLLQHLHRPFAVCKEVVIRDPHCLQQPVVAFLLKGDRPAYVLQHIFGCPRPHPSPEMAHKGAVVTVVGTSSGCVNLSPERIVPCHLPVPVHEILIRYRLKLLRRHPLPGMYQLTVFLVNHPWKCRCLLAAHRLHHLQDRLVSLPQQNIVTVFHGFPVIHGRVETAHHDNCLALFSEVPRQPISPHRVKGKDTYKNDVRIQNILHHQTGYGFTVHQSVGHSLLHDRRQCVQSDGRRPDISVIHKIVQRCRLIGSVSRLDKSHFHSYQSSSHTNLFVLQKLSLALDHLVNLLDIECHILHVLAPLDPSVGIDPL